MRLCTVCFSHSLIPAFLDYFPCLLRSLFCRVCVCVFGGGWGGGSCFCEMSPAAFGSKSCFATFCCCYCLTQCMEVRTKLWSWGSCAQLVYYHTETPKLQGHELNCEQLWFKGQQSLRLVSVSQAKPSLHSSGSRGGRVVLRTV